MSEDKDGTRARLTALAENRREALGRADEATVTLRDAVAEAVADGMTEVDAAKLAGVTRMTIRAWLGK